MTLIVHNYQKIIIKIYKMLSFRKLSSLAINLQRPTVALFTSDKWKDRDAASEKVFVSQQESNNITMQDNQ